MKYRLKKKKKILEILFIIMLKMIYNIIAKFFNNDYRNKV